GVYAARPAPISEKFSSFAGFTSVWMAAYFDYPVDLTPEMARRFPEIAKRPCQASIGATGTTASRQRNK
ncbi:MAG: hypothetical protein LBI87_09245, partial [Candidatus Accumulibacter sp.]|nr:hypothetical protein [Accumulibacter sp.]